jgi:hypothetical protein
MLTAPIAGKIAIFLVTDLGLLNRSGWHPGTKKAPGMSRGLGTANQTVYHQDE